MLFWGNRGAVRAKKGLKMLLGVKGSQFGKPALWVRRRVDRGGAATVEVRRCVEDHGGAPWRWLFVVCCTAVSTPTGSRAGARVLCEGSLQV